MEFRNHILFRKSKFMNDCVVQLLISEIKYGILRISEKFSIHKNYFVQRIQDKLNFEKSVIPIYLAAQKARIAVTLWDQFAHLNLDMMTSQ